MDPVITTNPKVMHGVPCFTRTRAAIQTFFDHLQAGYTIDGFLEAFPTVRREQATQLLARATGSDRMKVIEDVREGRTEHDAGKTKAASVDDIMREIES
jgi:uncharacterized protein (DUF433 family)